MTSPAAAASPPPTTTTPSLPPDASDADKLAVLTTRWPDQDSRFLAAYLTYKCKGNLEEAIAAYEAFLAWRTALGPIDVSSIEANLRAGEGHGPFMLALEYEGEAVGKHTPIVLMQGMIKGTREEMVKQVVYCAERVGALMPKEGPARVKFIVNTKGGGFRVPDSDYRAAVFDILQGYYPWLANQVQVIFLDPLYVVKAALWGMGKLFGPTWKEIFRAASSKDWPAGVDEDVAVYAGVVAPEKAVGWGADGSLQFDMGAYINDRKAAEEKGMDDASVSSLMHSQAMMDQANATNAAFDSVTQQMESALAFGMSG